MEKQKTNQERHKARCVGQAHPHSVHQLPLIGDVLKIVGCTNVKLDGLQM